jgi:RNA polymerase sigma-70 factor, ECF subfamily
MRFRRAKGAEVLGSHATDDRSSKDTADTEGPSCARKACVNNDLAESGSSAATQDHVQLYVGGRVTYNVEAMTTSDVQLMLDVKAGDEASFDLLLRRYRTPLVSFLYRMTRDSATAEDLAQEVFLRVYRARKQYSPTAKFTTWLFRIATNLALNSIRDNRHKQMETSIDAPGENEESAPMELASREMRIDEHMVERDRCDFIRRAVNSLPEKQRAAVLLHKYEEMDYGEIAKILDCSESALKSLLFRAYETLRVQLAPLVAMRVGRQAQPAQPATGEGRTS